MSIFENRGDPVRGQACPRCHNLTVVYNGNYFCTHCPWAMPERHTMRHKQIIVAYLAQRLEETTDPEDRARLEFYLSEYDGVMTR